MPCNTQAGGVLADYLTRTELAEQLGLNPRTLERWANLRRGPERTYVGNRVFYHRKHVERWLERQAGVSA